MPATTKELMKPRLPRPLAAVGGAVLLALAATAAQAGNDVFWSVGVDAAPGVSVGVGNSRPVIVQPAPVYVAPRPVYVAPRPVYVAPQPVYVAPPPRVVVVQQPVYVHPGKHKGWHKKHGHRHHDHDHD
jgi:hypothetical protein